MLFTAHAESRGLIVYGDVKVRHEQAFFSDVFWVGVL
jgi:hypothetical protein